MATAAEPRLIFNDSVHGSIQLDPLLVKIIDTPQFQRLRDIKQLGVCYWVYPGASHNRFEHCIGSSYICSEMINSLRSATQPELITDYESLCLRIAALCRDLGYGPFSHFFHNVLVPKLMDSRAQTSSSVNANASGRTINWARDASCKMFDFMLKENPKLKKALDKKLNPGSDGDKDWQRFIKDLIRGEDSKDAKEGCLFEGSQKSFLYEIVSNKRTRIDCNKFDYISRDCQNVGVKSNFDWRRYLLNIRIKKLKEDDKSELRIHVRDKDYLNLHDLFYARWSLYRRVYRHKTIAGIEDMLSEAILKVDTELKISNLIKDDWLLNEDDESMRRYTKLTDHIFYQILELEEEGSQSEKASGGLPVQEGSQSKDLEASGSQSKQATGGSKKEAKELLQNIQQRNLYKFCGQAELKDPCSWKADRKMDKQKFAKEIAAKSNGEEKVSEGDLFISFAYFHHGKEGENPMKDVCELSKLGQQQKPVSNMIQKFHECYIRVYAKPGQNNKHVQDAFKEWYNCHNKKEVIVIPDTFKLNDSVISMQPAEG